ncbi:plasminogen activator inhibitor 2 isoform X1 [Fukomys damarensis]|uniref:plasminogen activator inhibitor 2 isoform X1 n=1 Tax=Fukomys damarensis TaxID=885580 RepID=UPI001455666D|nr:plasminogen activator inhibitor 2 isoform X1 [Fukomys damarensis]
MASLAAANADFGFNLLREMDNSQGNENVFLSFLSIFTALSLVRLGARGDCAHQIDKVLQFNKVGDYDVATGSPENFTGCRLTQQMQKETYPATILKTQARDKVHSSFCSLSSAISAPTGDYLLESAIKLFGEKSARFKEEYIKLSKKYYSTEPQEVDFQKCAEESRKEINSWVNTQTKGKIPNLLPEGSVDEATKMVLVNAVYFKGKWKIPFEKKLDGLYPFRVNRTQSIPVKMMYLRKKLNIGYIADLKVQILELPYVGDVSMFLLLPDEIAEESTGLQLLESQINYDTLNKWTNNDTLAEDNVEVFMPQFKLEEHYELKSILRSMGMEDAFNKGQANFSGMSEEDEMFLSEVFHQATVDVNEEGTVAAAGTGAIMTGRTGHGGPQFVADHPFLFLIMHRITKSVLFFGRFSLPPN